MAESSIEMQSRENDSAPPDTPEEKRGLSVGKIFYKPGIVDEETDETSAYDNSMAESPMLGRFMGGGYLKPPLQIYPSNSLHRIPTYSSSIGQQSTVYRPDSCR